MIHMSPSLYIYMCYSYIQMHVYIWNHICSYVCAIHVMYIHMYILVHIHDYLCQRWDPLGQLGLLPFLLSYFISAGQPLRPLTSQRFPWLPSFAFHFWAPSFAFHCDVPAWLRGCAAQLGLPACVYGSVASKGVCRSKC